jgi:hypothetical protein
MSFFNDNSTPRGGFIAAFTTSSAVVERFNPVQPSKVVERPNEVGGPNGWDGVEAQNRATATVQIPTSAGSAIFLGDRFTEPAAFGGRKWVVTEISATYEMDNYWKQDLTLMRAHFTFS